MNACSTNSYNGTEVPFNTLLLSINLINYAASAYNSKYFLYNNSGVGRTDDIYVPYYGYLYLYLPFNSSSSTTISINNTKEYQL